MKTNFDGLPVAFALTGGEASDSLHFATLMNRGPDIQPSAVVADKRYDSAANRRIAHDSVPVIRFRNNIKAIPKVFGKALYRGRAHIEQATEKLKRFKHIAPRCEKTSRNVGAFVALAAASILIKSIHTV